MVKQNRCLLLLFILGILLFSCGQEESGQNEKTLVPSATLAASTQSNTPTFTLTPTKTETPPTTTPIPTSPPIEYTVIPTLPPDQAVDYFFSIYESFADCDPPCWGEIIPGKTTMEEVHSLLGSISEPKYNDNTYLVSEQGTEYLLTITSWRRNFGTIFMSWIVYGENGIVADVDFGVEGTNRTLSYLLSAYGKPDEIWLDAPISIFSDPIMSLGLYYKEENVFVSYLLDRVIKDDIQEGCGLFRHSMQVWSDQAEDIVFKDVYRSFWGGSEEAWLKETYNLESTTDWTIETFYEEFKDKSDQEVCISSPREYWEY